MSIYILNVSLSFDSALQAFQVQEHEATRTAKFQFTSMKSLRGN